MCAAGLYKKPEIMEMEYKFWKITEIKFLKENYPEKGGRWCAERLPSRTLAAVQRKCAKLGISKAEGKRWAPPAVPVKKRIISEEQRKVLVKAMLEKKKRSAQFYFTYLNNTLRVNYCPVGSTKSVCYKKWLWQQVYGPIPEGMSVLPKDGNGHNITISNLMLVKAGTEAKVHRRRFPLRERAILGKISAISKEINMRERLGLPEDKHLMNKRKELLSKSAIHQRKKALENEYTKRRTRD